MDFEEFCVLMQKKIAQETQAELLELFSIWDEAGKGIIESGELRCLLNRVPVRLTRREIDALVDYADTKKNGKINFEGTSHSLRKFTKKSKTTIVFQYVSFVSHNITSCPCSARLFLAKDRC